MILTRRGYAVLTVLVLGLLNATFYGPRALNAVVAPAGVALVAAVVLVRRVDRPRMERVVVEEGYVGETHTVELRFESDTAFTGHLVDHVPDGLAASGNELTTSIEETTVAYDVSFVRRGAHELGPTQVVARDVLGLAQRTFDYGYTKELLVYPRVHDLRGRARHELNLLPDVELINTRGEFDNLREYQRGDALRDIDWKKSAKATDGDFIVKEYVEEEDLGEVVIVAETAQDVRRGHVGEGARESADAMAEAAASVATFLLDAGLSVGVTVPGGSLDPEEERDQRRAILELLARTDPGHVRDAARADADLLILADGTDVTVSLGDQQVSFSRLAGDDAVQPPDPTVAVPVEG
jgi:uncharacterized protein (DUF58 family)